MARITTNPLSGNGDYTASRYPIIAALEGLETYVYQDGARGSNGGYATIGVGFLVPANPAAILQGMDPNLRTDLGLSDAGYLNLIAAIRAATTNPDFSPRVFASNTAAQTAIQNAVDGILGSPTNYPNNQIPQPAPSFTFQYGANPYNSDNAHTQMQKTFNVIVDGPSSYEALVDQWLNGTPNNSTQALPDSRERMALLSLAYNGLIGFRTVRAPDGTYSHTLKSPTLRQDILNGNRADAWYQIRYGSNGGSANSQFGTAKRRFYESTLAGAKWTAWLGRLILGLMLGTACLGAVAQNTALETKGAPRGEYVLRGAVEDGGFCADFTHNLNQFRYLGFQTCNPRLSPKYPQLSRPTWKEIPLDMDLAKKIIGSPPGMRWKYWLEATKAARAAGQVKMWRIRVDLFGDGHLETLVRLDHYQDSPKPYCSYIESRQIIVDIPEPKAAKWYSYAHFENSPALGGDMMYDAKTKRYYLLYWNKWTGAGGYGATLSDIGATASIVVSDADSRRIAQICWIEWVPTGHRK